MRRMMICGLLAVCLAACGGEAPPKQESYETETAADAPEIPVMGPERTILAFGNSLFAGYNVENDEAYPAQLERALRAQGINARVANAGVSGDTTAAGRQRLGFVLDGLEKKPDLAIVELGGNDLLRGLSPAETKANLSAMLEELRGRGIPVLLMGMRAPPNYGPEFQQQFDELYGELAEQYGAALVPFFLEPIYDQPQLIQSDRVHPTAEGLGKLVEFTVGDVAKALPEVS